MKFEYKLVRSDRKSISVGISSDNLITVRCPRGTSVEKVEIFLEQKRAWIEKHIKDNLRRLAVNAEVSEFRAIIIRGEKYPLVFGGENSVKDGVVYLKSKKNLKNLLLKYCGEEFLRRFSEITLKAGLCVKTVNFKNYKSRWGCCDRDANVIFAYQIFMLPVNLQYYIMVHELCHTVHFNHSEKFWNLVSSFVPDWKSLRKNLKDYDFVLKLY